MQEEKIVSTIDINHFMIDEQIFNLVMPGDQICTEEQGFMNGHGTYKDASGIYASQIGTVQKTNKLIIVNPLKNKYQPQIGDIVVGKIVEISNKKWKVNINAASFAILNLNSTYIPQQRKKNEQDQFNMRKVMKQGDMIVAQVHSINADKSCNLHTRNPKYGKLELGLFLQVQYKLIKRQKYHMISINKTGLILGNNGGIWISPNRRNDPKQQNNQKNQLTEKSMDQISILYNICKILNFENLQTSETIIKDLYNFIIQKNISSQQVLSRDGDVIQYLSASVRKRIPMRIEQQARQIRGN